MKSHSKNKKKNNIKKEARSRWSRFGTNIRRVRPTNAGKALARRAKTLLADYIPTLVRSACLNRVERESAAYLIYCGLRSKYLCPALAVPAAGIPKAEVKILDQTPGEMIVALQQGNIDLALTLLASTCSRAISTLVMATVRSVLRCREPPVRSENSVLSQLKGGETFVRDRTIRCPV